MGGGVERIHATCVAVGRHGILIRGPSGSGKSDLALRLIGTVPSSGFRVPQGPVRLVSDDQVLLRPGSRGPLATAPPAILGKLEVRGVGIIDCDVAGEADVMLVVDLCDRGKMPRLPDRDQCIEIAGQDVRFLVVDPFEPSAPIKVLIALADAVGRSSRTGQHP